MTRNDTIASLAVNSWINGDLVVWPKANLREANLRRADLRGATITLGNRTITPSEETAR
ncbi:MAG: pentapeptide repeat-containing protein [Pseudomonadota bacterium]